MEGLATATTAAHRNSADSAGSTGADHMPLRYGAEDVDAASGTYRKLGGPVALEAAGLRIDGFLAANFPFFSRSSWQVRLAEAKVLVNGRSAKSAARLKTGDQITLYAPVTVEPEVDKGIRLLWEKAGVMAMFKPGNLPMHENGPYRKNTFTELVWKQMGREWSAVHRLDRETSGIVLCGATPEIRSLLGTDWQRRKVRKTYQAIVRGVPSEECWTEHGPIGDLVASAIRIKKWVVPDGQLASTQFQVLLQTSTSALLEARPLTGRTNQIRIHSAYRGHVLYGDKLYHPDEEVFLEYFAKGQTANVTLRTGFPRLCLHACALEFTHPTAKTSEYVEAPLPPDLVAFWASLAARDAAGLP